MKRYYGHRVTKREREAVHRLYAPRQIRTIDERGPFNHSEQCDRYFSVISDKIGGVDHLGCRCWCHNAQHLFATPELEYDLTPPPEWANSADLAFLNTESVSIDRPTLVSDFENDTFDPESERFSEPEIIGFADVEPESFSEVVNQPNCLAEKFPNRCAHELATGKCDTCHDPLTVCECVE